MADLSPKIGAMVRMRVTGMLFEMQSRFPGIPIQLLAKDAITWDDKGQPTAVFGKPIERFLSQEANNLVARLGLDTEEAEKLKQEVRDRLNGTLETQLGDKLKAYDFNANGKMGLGELLMAYFLEMGGPRGGRRHGPMPTARPNFQPGRGWSGGVSLAQLQQIVSLPKSVKTTQGEVPIQYVIPHLNRAMAEAGIRHPREQAAFIAQLSLESAGFKTFIEYASGAAYEGRRDLGNTQSGDGKRFKGRGPIQLTGRANYRSAGQALGVPLEQHPEIAGTITHGFRVAAWFWRMRKIGPEFRKHEQQSGGYAGIDRASRLVNGGDNGLHQRRKYFDKALSVLT